MVKPLPPDDFRAARMVLEPDDFLIFEGEELPPSDLVDEDTWYGIVTWPDDVSIRTSNHHGELLKMLHELWEAWIEATGEPVDPTEEDPVQGTIWDAADEFEAATFNSLHGYYRSSVSCLRSVLEVIAVGAYCQICDQKEEYDQWRAGEITISFGRACDLLGQTEPVQNLEKYLRRSLDDSLLQQKTDSYPGGVARRLYSRLSNYTHSRPGYTQFDMWNSTGPIYRQEAFIETTQLHFGTCLVCFAFIKLGRQELVLPKPVQRLFDSEGIHPAKTIRAAYGYLFGEDKYTL